MKNIVICPARSGSKEVRHKNLRLLHDKTTLLSAAYTNSTLIDNENIFLSTDSELYSIIGENIGFKTLIRPPDLSDDTSTLDDLVSFYADQPWLNDDDILWILQVTCPFLEADTVSAISHKLFNEGIDSVFTVSPVKGFIWQQHGGDFHRLYQERSNRQSQRPSLFKESGLLTATRVSFIRAHNTRFHHELSKPVIITPEEAIDIDTYSDLRLAQEIYSKKAYRILLICSGSAEKGTGHIYRAMTLQDTLTSFQIELACIKDDLAISILSDNSRTFMSFNNYTEVTEWVKTVGYTAVIVDCLSVSFEFIKNLKSLDTKAIVFETRNHQIIGQADLVVNSLYEQSQPPANILSGYRYEILRPDILALSLFSLDSRQCSSNKSKRILFCFGGTDPNLMMKNLHHTYTQLQKWAQLSNTNLVICELLNHQLTNPSGWQPQSDFVKVETYSHSPAVSSLIFSADVLVSGNGRMVYEALALSTPCISIPQNSRECTHTFNAHVPGCEMLPYFRDLAPNQIFESIVKSLSFQHSPDSEKVVTALYNDLIEAPSRLHSELKLLLTQRAS